MNPYKDIYEQFVDEASFLWVLRSIAVEQPHYNLASLRELEQRIDAQLDGLMTAVEEAWEICLEALKLEEPGEVFTSTVIAFKSHDIAKIQSAVEVGLSNDEAVKGLISALGWLPGKLVHPWIKRFFSSKDLDHKYLALAACSVRQENPAQHLNQMLGRDDCKEHEKLYVRALRLIGEFKRQDLMQVLSEAAKSDSENIQFWSAWSAILLGDRAAVDQLEPFIFKNGPNQVKAIDIAFRVLPMEQARNWITRLVEDKQQIRAAVKATGVLGDPHAVNWLLGNMQDESVAKLSGEAFSFITGIDLEQSQLVLENPPGIAPQPNDDVEDNDVSLDEDEDLPWPEVEKISKIWINEGKNFVSGQRYFLGQAIRPEFLNDKLTNAYQRQRHAAALELSLLDSTIPLQNTRARAIS